MSTNINVVARHMEPFTPTIDNPQGPYPEMMQLRAWRHNGVTKEQRAAGADPDTTSVTVEWVGTAPGETEPRKHVLTYSIANAALRATKVGTVLHDYVVGPLSGKVVLGVDKQGGLVAELHYPTLPSPYRLDLL